MIRAGLLLLLVMVALAGCIVRKTEVVRMPVTESAQPLVEAAVTATSAGEHRVLRGETLYSIAFRNSLDWRDVAAWNRLPPPFTIYPGQRLHLRPPPGWMREPPIAAQPQPIPEADHGTVPASQMPPAPPAAAPPLTSPAPTAQRPAQPAAVSPRPEPPPPVSSSTPPVPTSTATVASLQWRWPTQGEVIQRYSSDAARQGIAIAGNGGQVVVAAADGEVVYSGSGLRGYGELIIIKHSAEYLSAYGHNRKRLVNEGERVRAGQPIAEMGRTGTDRDKLHFEIRRSGRPVDPMGFLPRR